MGGNALKEYETTRLTRPEYDRVVQHVSDVMKEKLGVEVHQIAFYKNKETFGDADLLVVSEDLPENWVEAVVNAFNLTKEQWVKNTNVLSIGVDNFQVDLITTPRKYLLSSQMYFGYNDFGNLIGRIGHKLGIKIGHDGLWLVVRPAGRDDHIIGEILLTTNIYLAFSVLGLDVVRYEQGFDDLEDIFKYVASSKYFDPEIYALENRSYTSRVRDRKRATYNKFLTWVEETKPTANHSFESKSELGGYSLRMPYYKTEVLKHWPWVGNVVRVLISDFEFEQEFKKVYNGKIVGELTRYTGKDLGEFMSKMKPTLDRYTKKQWIKDPTLVAPAVLAFLAKETEYDDE